MVNKFWEMCDKSVVISGVLALMLVAAVVYLAVTGQPIPEALLALASGACGYYFGAGKARDTAQVLKGK